MHRTIAAALALTAASSLHAQTIATPPAVDPAYAAPLLGSWSYAPIAGGSEITFRDTSARPQLTIRCARAERRLTIAKPASAAAPVLVVWTSSQTRSLPATFDPATAQLSATLAAYDPVLDALVFSRGRVAFSVAGSQLVLPAWGEISRVVEDCRV
ncbi:MAG: hypothetical protein ACJ8FL_00720 [Sphingomicrobium sp.]